MEASSSSPLDLLESAFDQAFTAPPPHETTLQPEIAPSTSNSSSTSNTRSEGDAESLETSFDPATDLWKSEYEAQVQTWRAQSAEAREKAEKERLKWEAIRAIERQEQAKKATGDKADISILHSRAETEIKSEVWESVAELSTAGSTNFSEVDKPKTFSQVPLVPGSSSAALPRTDSQLETATNESQKWEEVPSVSSSFPSMTFPENIEVTVPQPRAAPQQSAGSVTLAIFDSSLSTRTRLKAFFSSLAINLLLPFVNGVMLGFGEIFAKNIVMGWFGWNSSGPASTVTKIGIRGAREERQKQSK